MRAERDLAERAMRRRVGLFPLAQACAALARCGHQPSSELLPAAAGCVAARLDLRLERDAGGLRMRPLAQLLAAFAALGHFDPALVAAVQAWGRLRVALERFLRSL